MQHNICNWTPKGDFWSLCFTVRHHVQGSTSRPRCNPLGNRSWCIPESQGRFENLDLWHLETCLIQWTKMLQIYKANWAQLTSFQPRYSQIFLCCVQLRDVLWCLLCFLRRIGPRPAEAKPGARQGLRRKGRDGRTWWKCHHSTLHGWIKTREDGEPFSKFNHFLIRFLKRIKLVPVPWPSPCGSEWTLHHHKWIGKRSNQSSQPTPEQSPWGMQWKSLVVFQYVFIIFFRFHSFIRFITSLAPNAIDIFLGCDIV